MKTIIKVSRRCFLLFCTFTMVTALIPSAHAQVETAYIVVTPTTVQPDCHTYTGCGAIVVDPCSLHYFKRCSYSAVNPDSDAQ